MNGTQEAAVRCRLSPPKRKTGFQPVFLLGFAARRAAPSFDFTCSGRQSAPAPRFCFVRGCGTSRPTGGAFRPPGPPVFFPGPHVPPANPKQSPSFFSENDILTSLVSLIQYLVLHPVGILPGQAERLRALPSWIGGKPICFLRLLRPPPCSGPKLQFLTGWSAGA